MKKHIILERAKVYHPDNINLNAEGFCYNESKGYWVDAFDSPMAFSAKAPMAETKKCDVETGEDQKGE